jgi:hypothetical protein
MAPHLAAKNRKPCVPHGRLCGIPSEPLEPSARLTGLQRVRAASPIPLSPAARGVLIGKTPLPPSGVLYVPELILRLAIKTFGRAEEPAEPW